MDIARHDWGARRPRVAGVMLTIFLATAPAFAQTTPAAPTPSQPAPAPAPGAPAAPTATPAAAAAPTLPAGVALPPGYVVGAEDQLLVVYWREKDLSAEVVVRPDGKISLPLLNDVQAAGLTPEQLRVTVTEAAGKFVTDPTVSIVVKGINSRKVFITGQIAKPGQYPLTGPMTVMQLIATAGGVHEFADSENVLIMRTENGQPVAKRFNYKQVLDRKNLKQNIDLLPGDTVVIP